MVLDITSTQSYGGLTFLVIEGGPKFAEGPQTQF